MSQAEHPERLRTGREVTVDDVRQLMGASTPHFALQLRERIRNLIKTLPPDHPWTAMARRNLEALGPRKPEKKPRRRKKNPAPPAT